MLHTYTHCRIALPAGFRAEDILEFHRRDPQAVAERVAPGRLQKGLVVDGKAACLSLGFHPAHVDAELAIDSRSTAANEAALTRLVCRMLGLTQRIEIFEQDYRQHPQLGPLIARQSGLRVPLAATPFEALTWAITGQQISVGAAVSMRRKLIKAAGQTHSSGLACYPDAAQLAQLTEADLRAAGFSANKAQTLITVSAKVLSGELPLDAWQENMPIDTLRERLLLNRNELFAGGIRPHHYCLPVLKRERDREALLAAATSDDPRFFLGTDSAPHARHTKENACGCAGIFSAHAAIELYAEAFESAGKLDRLEAFASERGADFYGVPRNTGTLTLRKESWNVPDSYAFGPANESLVPFRAGATLAWRMLDPA